MFECIGSFDRILVTGPQRSGTRICAKMIARDLGYRFVDEREFDTANLRKLEILLDTEEKIVVQCPALSSYIHALEAPNALVIWMDRDPEEIAASQERIRWSAKGQRRLLFDILHEIPTTELKKMLWRWQKRHIPHYRHVEYRALRSHPLWVDKKDREGWAWDQTS